MSLFVPSNPVLIATLGTEAQVVTAALDLLIKTGERITQVVVVHTVAPGTPIEAACQLLEQAFAQPPYHGRISLRLVELVHPTGQPVADIEHPIEVQAAFRTLYREVLHIKRTGARVHFCIAGGRKTLAVFGMAAAQLLFDEEDRLWHLHSTGEYLDSKRLHPAKGDQVHLIPIPVIRWSLLSPALGEIGSIDDPIEAVKAVEQLQLREQVDTARAFILGALTEAERKAVELLVREGLTDGEIASRMFLSPRTIESHLRSAYMKAQAHWNLPSVSRVGLVRLLSLYYFTQIPGKPG